MINPQFKGINALLVLIFKNDDNDSSRDSYDHYYMSLVEIKNLNALINNKPFLISP